LRLFVVGEFLPTTYIYAKRFFFLSLHNRFFLSSQQKETRSRLI